jgi:hypothetical protein
MALKRSLNGARSGPTFMEHVSSQPQALAGLRIERGDVVLAGAGDLEAGLGQGLDHAASILDFALGYAVQDPIVDDLAGLAAPGLFDQADHIARPLRVLRVSPAVLFVQHVAQDIEGLGVAGRGDVEAAPGGQLHAGRREVQLHPPLVGVPHPKDIALAGLKAGEGQALEGVHGLDLLALGRPILGRERQDAGSIAPLMRRGVNQRLGARRTAAQDFGHGVTGDHHDPAGVVAQDVAVVAVGDDISGDQIADRASAAPLAVLEELDQHDG